MDINKLNYELYFVDYHEGNLSPEQVAELMVFLEQHSDLKAEFETFGGLEELNLNVEFADKGSLKKEVVATPNINEHNAEDFLIAELEGDLSPEEQTELNSFVEQNNFYKEDQELYQKTKLAAPVVSFADKASIKKPRIIPLWLQRVAGAAVAAMIIGCGIYIFKPDGIVYEPRNGVVELERIADPAENVQLAYQNLFGRFNEKPVVALSTTKGTASSLPEKSEQVPTPVPTAKSGSNVHENKSNPETEMGTTLPNKAVLSEEEFLTEAEEVVEVIKGDKIEHFKTKSHYVSPVKAMNNFLKKRVLKDESSVVRSHIEGIELAHTTLESVNKIFGTNLYLHPTYNGEGEMLSFVLESNKFAIHRNVKRKKKDQL